MLFLLIAGVSANDINTTDEISTTNDVDEMNESSTINHEVIAEDSNDLDNSDDKLEYSSEDNLSEEGEFIDVSEAYAYMNAFRTEDGVWYWNSDDTTKSVFNTNNTNQLKPLIIDSALEETAKTRAKEMALNGTLSHTRPDGSECWTAYPSYASGENIAYTYSTSCEYVTDLWKETTYQYSGQGHRRNMLSTRSNAIGIAGYKLNGKIWWVQSFGNNRNLDELTLIKPADAFTIINNTSPCEFKIELSDDASGTFIVKVDDNVLDSKILSKGKANITATGLSEGSHEVLISYSGDDKYYSVNQVTNVNITQNQNPTTPENNSIGAFTELNKLIQNAKEGNVIKLDKDYVFDNTSDSDFKEGINITKTLTIDGNGHTIDGKNYARIFNINSNSKNIFIKNINLVNGYNNGSGGAIYDRFITNITIINCNFTNNYANAKGGAICLYGRSYGNVAVVNCNFNNNFANGIAGAVYINSGNGSVVNCNFVNNSANHINGGAVHISSGNVAVVNCNFTNNSATNKGGAIHYTDCSNCSIINSSFINNTVNEYGGGLYLYNVTINIINCTFENNTAVDEGGAIVSFGFSNYTIDKSVFSNNHGGAISIIKSHESPICHIGKISNSIFKNNVEEGDGGAIGGWAPIIIHNSTFIGNTATGFGGAICLDNAYLLNISEINNCSFINNSANYHGGAVCIFGGCDVINSSFINNNGKDASILTYWNSQDTDHSTNGTVINCSFINNVRVGSLIGFCSSDGAVINCSFINNSYYYDDIISVAFGNVSIINPNYENNIKLIYEPDNDANSNITTDKSSKDTNQNTDSQKNTKKSTKITAKKKTFKAKTKTKKYTITLKAGKKAVKKVKVYLKIGKKTFKATTNKNGKATFKIKLNKKGTYKSKITFKGSKIYKATTKKVTIKIK